MAADDLSPLNMEVTALGPDDATPAVALWEACGLTRPWNDPTSDFLRAVSGPGSAVLGVRDGRSLVGTVMVGGDGHRGWVYYLATHPEHRHRGLGRALMDASENWLTANGLPKIQFMVRDTNREVLAFYERLGYERQDVVVLGRRLDPA